MSLIKFTKNYADHSNETGYQFEFFCDHCGNGYRSSFQPSKLGVAGGLLRAAGSIFGGSVWGAGQAADYVKDSLRGPAHDAAFNAAAQEAMPHFKQCTRCGKWVCPENCWNARKNMCEGCAPNLEKEAAAIQNEAAVEQIRTAAFNSDQIRGQVDVVHDMVVAPGAAVSSTCPHCGSGTQGSKKFCPECGKPLAVKTECPQCHAKLEPGMKFCGECGTKV